MAKKAVIARELKRTHLVEQYADKIAAYKLQLQKAYIDDESEDGDGGSVEGIYKKIRELPRDAYACRKRSRCFVCGRPNGVYKKVGLCRIHFRKFAMLGYIPGLRKASW